MKAKRTLVVLGVLVAVSFGNLAYADTVETVYPGNILQGVTATYMSYLDPYNWGYTYNTSSTYATYVVAPIARQAPDASAVTVVVHYYDRHSSLAITCYLLSSNGYQSSYYLDGPESSSDGQDDMTLSLNSVYTDGALALYCILPSEDSGDASLVYSIRVVETY